MLDQTSLEALTTACQNKLQVTLTYVKKTTGETVVHTIGVQELGGVNKAGQPVVWGWDTSLNDHIRAFLVDFIQGVQVLDIPYINSTGFPIKINGVEIGY